MTPCGLTFHHFENHVHISGQGSISERCFREIIEHVGRVNILPAEEWYSRALAGQLQDSDLCLTFDDGLLCQYDIAWPVMKEMGLTGFFFVYTSIYENGWERLELYRYFRTVYFDDVTDFYDAFYLITDKLLPKIDIIKCLNLVDISTYLSEKPFYSDEDRRFRFARDQILNSRQYYQIMDRMIEDSGLDINDVCRHLWMTPDNLKTLVKYGNIVGLHSHTHPTQITSLSTDEQIWEYDKNCQILKALSGRDPVCVSHPCGNYDTGILELLSKMNIRLGFCAEMNEGDRSLLECPRINHSIILSQMTQ